MEQVTSGNGSLLLQQAKAAEYVNRQHAAGLQGITDTATLFLLGWITWLSAFISRSLLLLAGARAKNPSAATSLGEKLAEIDEKGQAQISVGTLLKPAADASGGFLIPLYVVSGVPPAAVITSDKWQSPPRV